MRIMLILMFAAVVLTVAAYFRAPEYDEAYSIFLTAGHARPAWPIGIFQPGDVRYLYAGTATPGQIAANLRSGDVHPPLYFWLLEYWRRLAGPSWFAARLLSVMFSLATIAVLSRLARLADIPVVPALFVMLLSYGFVYTGIIARGFALAQLLNVVGVTCIYASRRKFDWRLALAGGLAFGAGSFSNYLAVFTALAGLFWFAFAARRWRLILPAAAGLALFLPADAWFFIAQKSSRIGQFDPFSFSRSIAMLAKDFAAALFGGLPLYAGSFGPAVVVFICGCLGASSLFVWRGRRPGLALFAIVAVATPAGLFALGLIFNSMPIELRYLAFSLPFIALLFAATLPARLLAVVLAVQAGAIIGLIAASGTMQPQAAAAAAAAAVALAPSGSLILLPFGGDGVGIPGPYISAAPDNLRILLVKADAMPDLAGERNIMIMRLLLDPASKVALHQLDDLLGKNPCWRAGSATKLVEVESYACAR